MADEMLEPCGYGQHLSHLPASHGCLWGFVSWSAFGSATVSRLTSMGLRAPSRERGHSLQPRGQWPVGYRGSLKMSPFQMAWLQFFRGDFSNGLTINIKYESNVSRGHKCFVCHLKFEGMGHLRGGRTQGFHHRRGMRMTGCLLSF